MVFLLSPMSAVHKHSGFFIQIDGIDGSGKSTLLAAATSWVEARGLKLFDVVAWSKEHGRIPAPEDVGNADVLLTAEPTHAGIGAVIREEIIKKDAPYNARFAAEAFALDRGVQYTRLILPFLHAQPHRWVIQDRGVLSSIAYQPLQSAWEHADDARAVTIDWIRELEGNRIALENPPDVFILLDIDPAIAEQRLAARDDKQDDARYEEKDFQIALAERYRMTATTSPLTSQGTRIILLNGADTKEHIGLKMHQLLTELAASKT